jgi:hypothetical protein
VTPKLLEDSVETQEDLTVSSTRIYRFYIPEPITKDENFQVKSVVFTALPISSKNEKISLQVSTKEDINPNSQTRRSVPGWRTGQTLRLSETYPEDWCTNCYVTILMDIDQPGVYSIQAKTNVGTPKLEADRRYDEVAFYGERNCYYYYVQSEITDIHVKVAQYSGMLSYFLNP